MSEDPYTTLSKRERQIMDVIHRLGEASVGDVTDKIPGNLNYDSIRILMGRLVNKGILMHRKEKKKYIYHPVKKSIEVKRSAMDHVLTTYFKKSVPGAVSALLSHKNISDQELDELQEMINEARKKQQ